MTARVASFQNVRAPGVRSTGVQVLVRYKHTVVQKRKTANRTEAMLRIV